MKTIKVVDIIGTPICVAYEDAVKVYNEIKTLYDQDIEACVSFEGYTHIVPLFLGVAIGDFYCVDDYIKPDEKIKVTGLSESDSEMLDICVSNSKKRWKENRFLNDIYDNDSWDVEDIGF